MSGRPETYGELYAETEKRLGSKFEATQLFTHVTQKKMQHMSFLSERPATRYQVDLLLKMCDRRLGGEPLQYLLGEWEFYSLPFKVGPGVLIPRPDTETLVDVALGYISDIPVPEVLDLCSGTGCVAVAISHERTDAKVTALELHAAAYAYLVKNIALNESRVKSVRADLNEYRHPSGLDLLVANPPYIPRGSLASLQPEVRREPQSALDGGKDGLSYYRTIMRVYAEQLKPGGHICFEVGIGQSEQVAQILRENGCSDIEVADDYAGIPRVVSGSVGQAAY